MSKCFSERLNTLVRQELNQLLLRWRTNCGSRTEIRKTKRQIIPLAQEEGQKIEMGKMPPIKTCIERSGERWGCWKQEWGRTK